MTVIIQEGNVGHMTAVGTVLVAGGLQTNTLLTKLMFSLNWQNYLKK